jgi:SAM-dependent methyltransferase
MKQKRTTNKDYLDINKKSWNNRVDTHFDSSFYDVKGFLKENTSLNSIELDLLGDIQDKSILHLQCHFGQDTISLARMGATAIGMDLSDKAIEKAGELAELCDVPTSFICCDIYELPKHLNQQFDLVFTSYGTIGWLPDMDKWAKVISHFLKPSGKLVFVEFHPVVWMFDDNFKDIGYNYFNSGEIAESETGSYADKNAKIEQDYIMWNHSMSEVLNALIDNGMNIRSLNEYNYSPYDCFKHTVEYEPGRFRIKHLDDKIPMVYSLVAIKKTK